MHIQSRSWLTLLLFILPAPLFAVEFKCKVVEVKSGIAKVALDSDLVPAVGDAVEIYFEIPGLDETVNVGSGKVAAVTADSIEVLIEQSKTKVTKNYLARIISPRPRKRSEIAPAPNSPTTAPSGGARKTAPGVVGNAIVLRGHDSPIQALAFHPLGDVGASAGNRAIFWDQTGKKQSQFVIDTYVVNCQYYSPNGRFVACGTTEGAVALRDTLSGREVLRLSSDASVESVIFFPDKRRLLIGLGSVFTRFEDLDKPAKVSKDQFIVRLWDAQTNTEVQRFAGHKFAVKAVAVSPDSRWAASGCEGTKVLVWDVASGKKLHQFSEPLGFAISSLCFSPDSRSLLVAGGQGGQLDPAELEDQLARLPGPGTPPPEVPPPPESVEAVEHVDERVLRLYDLESGKEIRKFRGHSSPVGSVTFFPDGRRILSGGSDHTLRIWDVATGRELMRLEGHQRPICCIALSPDGTFALSGDQDGEVRLWKFAQ